MLPPATSSPVRISAPPPRVPIQWDWWKTASSVISSAHAAGGWSAFPACWTTVVAPDPLVAVAGGGCPASRPATAASASAGHAAHWAVGRLFRAPRVLIPGVLILVAIAASSAWLFRHSRNTRWAKESALPEITRLMSMEKYAKLWLLLEELNSTFQTTRSCRV